MLECVGAIRLSHDEKSPSEPLEDIFLAIAEFLAEQDGKSLAVLEPLRDD